MRYLCAKWPACCIDEPFILYNAIIHFPTSNEMGIIIVIPIIDKHRDQDIAIINAKPHVDECVELISRTRTQTHIGESIASHSGLEISMAQI